MQLRSTFSPSVEALAQQDSRRDGIVAKRDKLMEVATALGRKEGEEKKEWRKELAMVRIGSRSAAKGKGL